MTAPVAPATAPPQGEMAGLDWAIVWRSGDELELEKHVLCSLPPSRAMQSKVGSGSENRSSTVK